MAQIKNQMKLTDREIRRLKTEEKCYYVWDTEVIVTVRR